MVFLHESQSVDYTRDDNTIRVVQQHLYVKKSVTELKLPFDTTSLQWVIKRFAARSYFFYTCECC